MSDVGNLAASPRKNAVGRMRVGDTVFAKVRLFTLTDIYFRGDEFVVIGEVTRDMSCLPSFDLLHVPSGRCIMGVERSAVSRSEPRMYVSNGRPRGGPGRRRRRR